MKRVERFLKIAYKNTFNSEHRFPMSAVLAQRGRVVSVGVNQIKTHPKQEQRINNLGGRYGMNRPHAELDCLIRANYEDISGGILYVVRRKKNLDFGIARPCELCLDTLRRYKVKHIYYSIDHPLLKGGEWYDKISL